MRLLLINRSVLLTAPTGREKTHAALKAARVSVAQSHTVLMIVPLKALVAEIQASWQAALPEAVVAHDTRDQRRHVPYRNANILLMTPERLDVCTRAWRRHHRWMARVNLVIVDEVHLMHDEHRGAAGGGTDSAASGHAAD
nr:DEAD/DEAH box helicase [Deinococcus sp. KNUC1210]